RAVRQQPFLVRREVVVPCRSGIHDDVRRTALRRQLGGCELRRQERAGAAAAPARADRDLPDLFPLLRRRLRAEWNVALLRQLQTGRPSRLAPQLRGDQGEAGLIEEGGKGGLDVQAGLGGDVGEEVARGRARVRVRLQVPLHAAAELFRADELLEHVDDRRALLV